MAEKVTRTNEALWAQCKQEAVESMGKFSARAMQRAVVLYPACRPQKSPESE